MSATLMHRTQATTASSFTRVQGTLHPAMAILATLAGALVLPLAFPDRGWWVCAPIAVLLLLWGVRGQRPAFAAWLGFLAGLVFYLLHVAWTALFLGPLPWVALSTLMALWWAGAYVLIAIAYRRLPWRTGRFRSLGALPVAIASIWTLREALASTVPYGGFSWGRLAQSQSNSPLVELVSWVGLGGLGFLIVWWCAFLIELRHEPGVRSLIPESPRLPGVRPRSIATRARATRRDRGIDAILKIGVLVVTGGLLATWPLWPTKESGTVTVLAVQGDTPGASYFIPSERGEIMAAHAEATMLAETGGDVDLVLWPEGSVDVSPWYSAASAQLLDDVSESVGAPVLANTVTRTGDYDEPSTEYFNSQFLWVPGSGPVGQYDKAHPIPFGEYVPHRDFYMSLAPDLVGLIQREYTPGTRSNVIVSEGVGYGIFICYDIVDDALIRAAIDDGAEVLLTPTNNADFGFTEESGQQLATARLRAVETGRSLVQASTVGWSAAYLPDGTEAAALDWYEPGAFTVELPTSSDRTLAMLLGRGLEIYLAGVGVVLLLSARRPGTRRQRA